MYSNIIINKAKKLRIKGMSYAEISQSLEIDVPKSTLSYWFKSLKMPEKSLIIVKSRSLSHLKMARIIAQNKHDARRKEYFNKLIKNNINLADVIKDVKVSKIALAVLYIGEGGKNLRRASLLFGNSDPKVIALFLKLLRKCYKIDEHKFRCTVQCRWGQDTNELVNYWMRITKIPLSQFYKSRIDPRTVNTIMKKPEYKGVCRIDYLSASVFHDILSIIDVVTGARSSTGGASGWQSEG